MTFCLERGEPLLSSSDYDNSLAEPGAGRFVTQDTHVGEQNSRMSKQEHAVEDDRSPAPPTESLAALTRSAQPRSDVHSAIANDARVGVIGGDESRDVFGRRRAVALSDPEEPSRGGGAVRGVIAQDAHPDAVFDLAEVAHDLAGGRHRRRHHRHRRVLLIMYSANQVGLVNCLNADYTDGTHVALPGASMTSGPDGTGARLVHAALGGERLPACVRRA